ncbi:hypothetical protein [Pantoea sp. GD03673]|uniref:hypothetical protein n=1 Tax=Pantoea sp. GD03673 TaxID=2975364 RepID=UPI002449E521|nr:hypothetical protein [Pantoea sp. GD03673]MDH2069249.1 hypothetical protein [Pantoea sp. GD03673]
MADEARVLVTFPRAQQHLKEDGPIRTRAALFVLKENGWQLAGKLKKAFPCWTT